MEDQLTEEQAKQLWQQLDNEAAAPTTASAEDSPPPDMTAAPAAAEEQVAEDPYAGLSEAQKAKMIGMETMVGQLTNRLRNVEGHIGGLKSQLTAQQHAAHEVRQEGGDAPTASQIRDAQGDPQAMRKLREDYPEFAEAIQSVIGQTAAQLRQEFQPQQTGLTMKDLNEAMVEFTHPGWKSAVQTPQFVGWLQQQPAEIQKLAESDLAADAVKLLDTWKKPNAVKQERNQRLETQSSLPTGRSGQSRGKAIDEMTDAEYWAYLDKQEKS